MARASSRLRTAVVGGFALGFLLAGALPGNAQLHFGPHVAAGSDSGFGLGAQAAFPLRVGPGFMDGSLDGTYFLGGGSAVDSWLDANLNVRMVIPLAADFSTRVGGGLNASFISLDTPGTPTTDTETEFGLNLLFGLEYPRDGILGGRAIPYGEVRAVIGGSEQVVFSAGLLFGRRQVEDDG